MTDELKPVAFLRKCKITLIDGETFEGLTLTDDADERGFPVHYISGLSALREENERLKFAAEQHGTNVERAENQWRQWEARATAAEARLAEERDAIAAEARRYAGFYPEASDGRNTFILLAEWIEARGGGSSSNGERG
ncbi:MAG TPA: hypothetical protein VK181_23245 [Rhizobium sp.]|nr:hypothetical protein [Rhizobium sp.]